MIVYQLYTRSFRDSNGDGIGDIPGIIEKLDYLQDLGVDAVWLNPIFPSPQRDYGYDVSDYCSIAPEYGTLQDFDRLTGEMHRRGLKLILDLVLNHTSDEHPWFRESAYGRDNPRRDWYIWRDGRKRGKPPNNWKSLTGGRAWRYFADTGQWVYFHFLPFEVDLNYRNPAVKQAMMDAARFWLERGVDGFRLDLLHGIYEDQALRDNPFSWQLLPSDDSVSGWLQRHQYDLNLPETCEFASELRQVVARYGADRVLIGEVFGSLDECVNYCLPAGSALQMVFLFEFTSTAFHPGKYARVIRHIENHFPQPHTPTYTLSNHDRMRFISRIDNDPLRAKLAAMLQLTLRGTPFIYYGEEIGMTHPTLPLRTSNDPVAGKYRWLPVHSVRRFGFTMNRDESRTPMQWDGAPGAGFSVDPAVEPWLAVTPGYPQINVSCQHEDPASLLNCYRRLIRVRRASPALCEGSLQIMDMARLGNKCLAYRRSHPSGDVLTYLNFSGSTIEVPTPAGQPHLLASTTRTELKRRAGLLQLAPREGVLLTIS